jgi:hypothetical protein
MSCQMNRPEALLVSRVRNFFALIFIAALPAFLVACGGGGGDAVSSDSDPREVLEKAFSQESAVNSAKIDASMTIKVDGDKGGEMNIGVNGALANAGGDTPDTDIDFKVDGELDGESIDFKAGAVLLPDSGFVKLDGETYEIDPGMYEQIRGQVAQQTKDQEAGENGGLFGSLDPEAFLENVSNEGTEDVEGVETVKISGTVDTEKAMAEFESFMDSADQLQGLGMEAPGSKEFEEVSEALGDVDFTIYVGTDDAIIRKMEYSAPVNPPDEDTSGSFSVSITLTDVNEDQEISAPADAKPFDELIAAIGDGALGDLGVDGFNDLGQLGGDGGSPFDQLNDLLGGSDDSKGGKKKQSGGSSGGPSADQVQDAIDQAQAEVEKAMENVPDQAKQAIECAQKAKSVEDLNKCEELVR